MYSLHSSHLTYDFETAFYFTSYLVLNFTFAFLLLFYSLHSTRSRNFSSPPLWKSIYWASLFRRHPISLVKLKYTGLASATAMPRAAPLKFPLELILLAVLAPEYVIFRTNYVFFFSWLSMSFSWFLIFFFLKKIHLFLDPLMPLFLDSFIWW